MRVLATIVLFLVAIALYAKYKKRNKRSLTPVVIPSPRDEQVLALKNSIISAMERNYGKGKVVGVNILSDDHLTNIKYPAMHTAELCLADGRKIVRKVHVAELN